MYQYDKPGCWEMAYRVPENLFGKTYQKSRQVTDRINATLVENQLNRGGKSGVNTFKEKRRSAAMAQTFSKPFHL